MYIFPDSKLLGLFSRLAVYLQCVPMRFLLCFLRRIPALQNLAFFFPIRYKAKQFLHRPFYAYKYRHFSQNENSSHFTRYWDIWYCFIPVLVFQNNSIAIPIFLVNDFPRWFMTKNSRLLFWFGKIISN